MEVINNINDEQLKAQLEKLKQGDYIYLSNWYSGKNKAGYNGYLVDLNSNSIYEFESTGVFDETYKSEAHIKKTNSFSYNSKTNLIEYIKNEKLFYFDGIEKLVFDMGTNIEVSIGNIKSKISNADSMCSNGKFSVYDNLKAIIEIIKQENYVKSNEDKKETPKLDNEESAFTSFKDLNYEELLVLRNKKIQQCWDKINGINLNKDEEANDGYLFFNTKMIIENIKFIDSKLINKFANNLGAETYGLIKNELQMLEEKEKTYVNITDVASILNNIIKINL